MMKVKLIVTDEQRKIAFNIRNEVFVEEQQVPREDEFDEFENESRHFLATIHQQPCGAARWRYTPKGIKLERFAVLSSFRRQGVASALLQAVIDDVQAQPNTEGRLMYMHAQTTALPLYKKFGFKVQGDLFVECDIEHYLMTKVVKA
ncbi:GNAT family N-acetyltransferase [Microscilla marina]|uniref:Acetyltransferase, gnat family n=1 Tax=Microscilla marina ATCC 23134 TaxID=313606 RepID=A1ZF96_MICM2|nr:GNAT family N-acetyltransferase [Microscilla marina]EAY31198.1 acetyltransferase, gnat family [Microscilla marina ATCC 23134]